MLSDSDFIASYFRKLEADEHDAAEFLCQVFYEKLAAIARRQFGAFPLRVIDEYAIANEVLQSFHMRAKQGEFASVRDDSELLMTLSQLTRDRVIDAIRRQTAQKRGGGRTRGNSVFSPTDSRRNGGFDQFPANKESPSSREIATEQLRQLLEKLTASDLRTILVLRYAGFTNEEIADQMKLSIATIERKRRRIREQLSDDYPAELADS